MLTIWYVFKVKEKWSGSHLQVHPENISQHLSFLKSFLRLLFAVKASLVIQTPRNCGRPRWLCGFSREVCFWGLAVVEGWCTGLSYATVINMVTKRGPGAENWQRDTLSSTQIHEAASAACDRLLSARLAATSLSLALASGAEGKGHISRP